MGLEAICIVFQLKDTVMEGPGSTLLSSLLGPRIEKVKVARVLPGGPVWGLCPSPTATMGCEIVQDTAVGTVPKAAVLVWALWGGRTNRREAERCRVSVGGTDSVLGGRSPLSTTDTLEPLGEDRRVCV